MKKYYKLIIFIVLIYIIILLGVCFIVFQKDNLLSEQSILNSDECKLDIPKISSNTDNNNDGIVDSEDILAGARIDVENKPVYISKYYDGGYPPDNEGVCSDVIWRALKNAGYNLKDLVDVDIANNISKYPRVEGKPDKNIDFRRVANLIIYFDRHSTQLTTELIPNDVENLSQWQGGDIVVFDKPKEHIAIVSDKRNREGVPYMIHNASPYTREADEILYWNENLSKIIKHYRFSR